MQGKVTIEIKLGNYAMRTVEQLADALNKLALVIRDLAYCEYTDTLSIFDINGNKVGQCNFILEEEEVRRAKR